MGLLVSGGAGNFPQVGLNRTRADMVKDILDYIGGESSNIMKERAARALNAASREFNTVSWTFQRVTEDIILDPTLGMTKSTVAPSIARDAGVGTGFTLDSGAQIQYWIEERVKVNGAIIKRNFTDFGSAGIVTLTGDGSNDKPVITRPAQVNPDATHWALYATGARTSSNLTTGAYPEGAQIAEVDIATTTIEDTRTGNNPPLLAGAEIYRLSEYDLTSDFRDAVRCHLLDTAGRERASLIYVPWREFSFRLTRLAQVSRPFWYTVRNAFRTGKVTFYPRLGPNQVFPVARIVYHSRILPLSGDNDQFIVPLEVEEAIVRRACAIMVAKYKSMEDGQELKVEANSLRTEVESAWADYEDFS